MNLIELTDPRTNWGIKRRKDGRFVIIDAILGYDLDSCQGHGFGSYEKAFNYGRNKYHTDGACTGEPNIDELITLF